METCPIIRDIWKEIILPMLDVKGEMWLTHPAELVRLRLTCRWFYYILAHHHMLGKVPLDLHVCDPGGYGESKDPWHQSLVFYGSWKMHPQTVARVFMANAYPFNKEDIKKSVSRPTLKWNYYWTTHPDELVAREFFANDDRDAFLRYLKVVQTPSPSEKKLSWYYFEDKAIKWDRVWYFEEWIKSGQSITIFHLSDMVKKNAIHCLEFYETTLPTDDAARTRVLRGHLDTVKKWERSFRELNPTHGPQHTPLMEWLQGRLTAKPRETRKRSRVGVLKKRATKKARFE